MYWLKLDVFKGQNKEELSMIEVAHAILEEKGDTIAFADLTNEIQNYLGKSGSGWVVFMVWLEVAVVV